jgi:cell division protein ZapA
MAEVTLLIGGRSYRLACRDGEEQELRTAGGLLESRVAGLLASQGAVAEPRLLLMAALLLAGELHERGRATPAAPPAPAEDQPDLPALAARVAALAARAEALADQLERAGSAGG